MKDFQTHRKFPRRNRFQDLPARFGDLSGPGPQSALSGHEAGRVGHLGHEAAQVGYTPSQVLQNPLQGIAVRAPVGSAGKVSYGFRKGWTGTDEPTVEDTGIYMPASAQIGQSIAGTQETLTSATGFQVTHNLLWKSGTSFLGTLDHANSADRVYTFQNADGTVAFTSDIPTTEQTQDLVGDMLEDTSTINLAYNDTTGKFTAEVIDASVTFAKIQDFAANTIALRNAGTTGAADDVKISGLTAHGSPVAGDLLLGETAAGSLVKIDVGDLGGGLTSPVGIADGGTGQTTQTAAFDALSPNTTAGDISYHNGTDNVRLAIGTAGHVLRVNSGATAPEYARNQGAVVYVPTTGDFDISEITDVTINSRDVSGVAAADQLVVSTAFTILNDSAAGRIYNITLDFDGLFDIEFATGTLANSSTAIHPFSITAYLDVRASNLCYMVIEVVGNVVGGTVSGADTAMAATMLGQVLWATSTSDVTGTTTVSLKIRSANANATQTARLHHYKIEHLRPT